MNLFLAIHRVLKHHRWIRCKLPIFSKENKDAHQNDSILELTI